MLGKITDAYTSWIGKHNPLLQPYIWLFETIANGLGLDKSYVEGKATSDFMDEFNANPFTSAIGANFLHTGLTGEQKAQMLWQENMDNTKIQRSVADANAAGINPMALFGGSSGPSASTPSGGSSLSDGLNGILQLMGTLGLLPSQIQLMKSQSEKTAAEAKNIEQKTKTEEYNTEIARIASEWNGELNAASVDKMRSEIDKLVADTDLSLANTDLVKSKKDAQDIINEYLPEYYMADIHSKDASARYADAQAAFTHVQAEYARSHGYMMSSNDMLLTLNYLLSAFGVEDMAGNANNFITRSIKAVKSVFRRKENPSGKSSHGGSR